MGFPSSSYYSSSSVTGAPSSCTFILLDIIKLLGKQDRCFLIGFRNSAVQTDSKGLTYSSLIARALALKVLLPSTLLLKPPNTKNQFISGEWHIDEKGNIGKSSDLIEVLDHRSLSKSNSAIFLENHLGIDILITFLPGSSCF